VRGGGWLGGEEGVVGCEGRGEKEDDSKKRTRVAEREGGGVGEGSRWCEEWRDSSHVFFSHAQRITH